MRPIIATLALITVVRGDARVVSYEGNSFPEEQGWTRVEPYCTPERALVDDALVLDLDLGCFPPPSGGDRDIYQRSIAEFDQHTSFFVEFSVFPEGPSSELYWGSPAVMSVSSQGPVFYYFELTRDIVRLYRGNEFPAPFIPVDPAIGHRHRLEILGTTSFTWYIDGEVTLTALPEAQYPSYNPHIAWSGKAAHFPVTVTWDFVRYGQIAQPHSGDYDSDGDLDTRDAFYLAECISDRGNRPGIPTEVGCLWADLDQSGSVDFADFAAFQRMFTGGDNK